MFKNKFVYLCLLCTFLYSFYSYAGDSKAIIDCANQRFVAQGFQSGMQNRFRIYTFAGKVFDQLMRECIQRVGSLEDKIQSPNEVKVLPVNYEVFEPEYSLESPTAI